MASMITQVRYNLYGSGGSSDALVIAKTNNKEFQHTMVSTNAEAKAIFRGAKAPEQLKEFFKKDVKHIDTQYELPPEAKKTNGFFSYFFSGTPQKTEEQIQEEQASAKLAPLSKRSGKVLSMELKDIPATGSAEVNVYSLTTKKDDDGETTQSLTKSQTSSFVIGRGRKEGSFQIKTFGNKTYSHFSTVNTEAVKQTFDYVYEELDHLQDKLLALISDHKKTTLSDEYKEFSRAERNEISKAFATEYERLNKEFELLYHRAGLPLANFYTKSKEVQTKSETEHLGAYNATTEKLTDLRQSFYDMQVAENGYNIESDYREHVNTFVKENCTPGTAIEDGSLEGEAYRLLNEQVKEFKRVYKFFTTGLGRTIPAEKRFELLVPLEHNIRRLDASLKDPAMKMLDPSKDAVLCTNITEFREASKTFFKGEATSQLATLLGTKKTEVEGKISRLGNDQDRESKEKRAKYEDLQFELEKAIAYVTDQTVIEDMNKELFGSIHEPVIYSLVNYMRNKQEALNKAENAYRQNPTKETLEGSVKAKEAALTLLIEPKYSQNGTSITNGDEIINKVLEGSKFYNMYVDNKHLLPDFYRKGIINYYAEYYRTLTENYIAECDAFEAAQGPDYEGGAGFMRSSRSSFFSSRSKNSSDSIEKERAKRSKDILSAIKKNSRASRSRSGSSSSGGFFSFLPSFGRTRSTSSYYGSSSSSHGLDPNFFGVLVAALGDSHD